MNILLFGATGRVGQALLNDALARGDAVTAVVRDPARLVLTHERLTVIKGDLASAAQITALRPGQFDALVNVIGADPLKPSTVVTDAARALTALAERLAIARYLGITGTAEMPKTLLGKLSIAILRLTPVRHAARDHDGALAIVRQSKLEWSLVGCPYISEGPTRRVYRTSRVFPGGFKIIHPGDVADAILKELTERRASREIVGVWY